MLYFKPVTDIDEIKAVYKDKQLSADSARIIAIDGDEEKGSCYISVDAQKCFLSDIVSEENDDLLVEGLIRSALNFAANRGAYIAVCRECEFKSVLEFLGFENTDGIYQGEIPELLKGSCCKKTDKS
ncbi:MAG: hypothetical protein IJK26_04345 [Clostridia bacterium]|nr:hypothetical protein [Clostridia bacterium]